MLSYYAQLVRSKYHFTIGLVAYLSFQIERYLAILLLDDSSLALFFRVASIASILGQFFTILCFNRVVKLIYDYFRSSVPYMANSTIIRELGFCSLITLSASLMYWFFRPFLDYYLPSSLPSPALFTLATLPLLVRLAFDFLCLKLNYIRKEMTILVYRLLAVIAVLLFSLVLFPKFEIQGLFLGALGGFSLLTLMLALHTHRLDFPSPSIQKHVASK